MTRVTVTRIREWSIMAELYYIFIARRTTHNRAIFSNKRGKEGRWKERLLRNRCQKRYRGMGARCGKIVQRSHDRALNAVIGAISAAIVTIIYLISIHPAQDYVSLDTTRAMFHWRKWRSSWRVHLGQPLPVSSSGAKTRPATTTTTRHDDKHRPAPSHPSGNLFNLKSSIMA